MLSESTRKSRLINKIQDEVERIGTQIRDLRDAGFGISRTYEDQTARMPSENHTTSYLQRYLANLKKITKTKIQDAASSYLYTPTKFNPQTGNIEYGEQRLITRNVGQRGRLGMARVAKAEKEQSAWIRKVPQSLFDLADHEVSNMLDAKIVRNRNRRDEHGRWKFEGTTDGYEYEQFRYVQQLYNDFKTANKNKEGSNEWFSGIKGQLNMFISRIMDDEDEFPSFQEKRARHLAGDLSRILTGKGLPPKLNYDLDMSPKGTPWEDPNDETQYDMNE